MIIRKTLISLYIFIAGCTVGPDYQGPPELADAEGWAYPTGETGSGNDPSITWWEVFDDPLLESYVATAVADNPELRAASERVNQARALRREARAPFFPSFNTEAGHSREGTSGATTATFSGGARRTIFRGSVDASWELDLFGGTRRASEAADARIDFTVEDERALRLAIVAEVARAYFDVRGFQKRIAILDKNIELQASTYQLVRDRFQIGEASEFDLSRARGQLQLTRSLRPDLAADRNAAAFRLAVLLGRTPNGILEELGSPPAIHSRTAEDLLPIGQRADILRRRPDIRAAERTLAAATADIGVAVADLFPSFFLLSDAGRAASDFSVLRLPISNTYSASQLLSWPFLQGGELRARINSEKAEAAEAAALYEAEVLEAIADVETALVRYLRKRETRSLLEKAVESRRRSAELAVARFDSGEEDFLSVLDAERELTSIEDELVISETETRLNLVTLYTALGGGWQYFEVAEPTTDSP